MGLRRETHRGHSRATFVGKQFQPATQLPHPLVHASDSNPEASHPLLAEFGQKFWTNAFSVSFDFQNTHSVLHQQTNVGGRTARMPVNVREALLENTKQCQLRVSRQVTDLS